MGGARARKWSPSAARQRGHQGYHEKMRGGGMYEPNLHSPKHHGNQCVTENDGSGGGRGESVFKI